MRAYNTIEYLGIWEQLNNPNFNPLEFEGFLQKAGSNAFTLSPQKRELYIKILLLNLLSGFRKNLNYI